MGPQGAAHDLARCKWQASRRRRQSRHAVALGPPRRAGAHRHEIRLRPRPVRRVHGACGRHGRPLLPDRRVDAVGKKITTIEGLSPTSTHPLQVAWVAEQVPQCGYCQSGQIMSAAALLAKTPRPTDAEIDTAMTGNICRCGTYQRIQRAIHRAAQA